MTLHVETEKFLFDLSVELIDGEPGELLPELTRAAVFLAESRELAELAVYQKNAESTLFDRVVSSATHGSAFLPQSIPNTIPGGLKDSLHFSFVQMLDHGRSALVLPIFEDSNLAGLIALIGLDPRMPPTNGDGSLYKQFALMAIRTLRRSNLMAALQMESHLLKTLMQNLPDAIYFKDLQSRFTRVSRQVVEQNGLSHASQLIGKTDFDLFTSEHAGQAYADEQRVIESGKPIISKEEKETWPDGRETWVLTTKMPFHDEMGRVIGTFGMSRDITQLRTTQAALELSEEQLRQRIIAMESDLDHARRIQALLLPSSAPEVDFLKIAFRYQPLDAVGGDYFNFFPFPDGSMGFFLGDLTGHGVSAALFMSLVKSCVERVVIANGCRPARCLEAMDRELKNQIPNGFITAVYGIFNPNPDGTIRLICAGAGHPLPVLHRTGAVDAEFIQTGDGALGLFSAIERQEIELMLNPGDRLYIYTDGIPEAQDYTGEMLGFDEVPEFFQSASQPTLEKTADGIIDRLKRFRGEAPLEDDVALVIFEAIKPKG